MVKWWVCVRADGARELFYGGIPSASDYPGGWSGPYSSKREALKHV